MEVPELDGLSATARRLDQVDRLVRRAAARATGRPESDFEVELDTQLREPVAKRVRFARALAAEAADLQAKSSKLNRLTVAELAHAEGLPLRDIGMILGISFQRAGQLLKEAAGQVTEPCS